MPGAPTTLSRALGSRLRSGALLGFLGAFIVAGCSDQVAPTAPELEVPTAVASAPTGPQTGIRISRRESVLSTRDVSQLRVVDASGNAVPASEVTWESGLPGVATVSSRGWVSGVAPGVAVITARRGEAIAQHSALVIGGGSSALRVRPRESVLGVGENQQLRVTNGSGASVSSSDVTWSSSAPAVAEVSRTGRVSTRSPGHAIISVRRGGFVAQHGVLVVGEASTASRSLRRVRGDGQSAAPGARLGTRPAVRVVDASGNGISGVTVRWSVRSGGGTVSSSSTSTNSSGEASVAWTLGSQAGEQSLEASAAGVGTVRFSANASSSNNSGTLRMTRTLSVLGRGDVSQLGVVDGSGNAVPAAEVTWTSGLSSVATVSSRGLVRGIAPGVAIIAASRGNAVAFHQAVVVGGGSSALRLSSRESRLDVGESVQLNATDANGNRVSSSQVSWSSSDRSVATVSSSGVVRAVSGGAAIITARRGSGVAQHGVLVGGEASSPPSTERSLRRVRGDGQSGPAGSRLGVRPTVRVVDGAGNGVSGVTVRWSVVAGGGSTSSGSSTTGSSGEASVAWTLGGNAGSQTLEARVSGLSAVRFQATATASSSNNSGGIRITTPQSVLGRGDQSLLRVVDESGRSVPASELTFSSGSDAVATVSSSGWVRGVAPGMVVIAARRGSAVAHHSAIVVGGGSSALRIAPAQSVLAPGESTQLRTTDARWSSVNPGSVSWSSSGSSVASVSSSGRVTANASGTVVITGRRNGYLAQHSVVVTGGSSSPPPPPSRTVDRIRVSPGSSTLDEGGSIQLQATALDRSGNAINASFSWSSDRPSVASVSSGGRVSARAEGSTTIRVSSGGVTGTHQVSVRPPPSPSPPSSGNFNEPSGYRTLVDEHWNSFATNNWWHRITNDGNVNIQNGRVVWTYTPGMNGGHTPGGLVAKDIWHGPYQYHRDEGVRLSSNFRGHRSAVNKFRYWSGLWPRAYLGFFGSGDDELEIGINTDGWPEGPGRLRWDTSSNRARPTAAQSLVRRGVDNTIETLTYVGTPGRSDGWVRVWLNGVLVLDFRNLAIIPSGERAQLSQVHMAPVWGGVGDEITRTQTLSVDRTYVSVR